MRSIGEFKIIYDRDSDVLYITTPERPAERGLEDEFGLVWRYDGNNRALGCTVVDFAEYWYPARRCQLAKAIAKHLELPFDQMRDVLDHVSENKDSA